MEINIPTGQDILRDVAIQYVNKAFVYITDCNRPLTEIEKPLSPGFRTFHIILTQSE